MDILTFEYENYVYAVIKDKKDIRILKKNKEGRIFDLTERDKRICREVIKQVIPTEVINLGYLNLLDKRILHLFDKEKGYHLFYQVNGETFKIPEKEILIKLNKGFNNQRAYVASIFDKVKETNYFKRIVKIGKQAITVLVSATILFSVNNILQDVQIPEENNMEPIYVVDLLNSKDLIDEQKEVKIEAESDVLVEVSKQVETSSSVKETSTDKYIPKLIVIEDEVEIEKTAEVEAPKLETKEMKLQAYYVALNSNPFLSPAEKQFFLSNPKFFEDGIEYFDMDTVLERASNLKTVYDPNYDGHLKGKFEHDGENKDTITVYNCDSFENCDKSKLSHEYMHTFTKYQESSNAFGVGLAEVVNVMYNNEYFGTVYSPESSHNYDDSYSWVRNYSYALAETLGSETLRKYHADANPDIIVNDLMKIIPDEQKAMNVAIGLDFLVWNYDPEAEDNELYETVSQDFAQDLKDFYEAKYNTSIENDQYASYLLQPESFYEGLQSDLNIDAEQLNICENTIEVEQTKKYFNSDLSQEDSMKISMDTEVTETEAHYTTEELVNIYPQYETGEIDLPMDAEGKYIVTGFETSNKVEYDLGSNLDYTYIR